ncbi:MAG: hypothetical protein FH756_17055 [Firmicutes bacterium]|nr:hypothetical protein [Bacillota bacterium]
MVAVGSLGKIWMEVPEDAEDMETLSGEFAAFFGARWEDVMVGGDKPFVYHKDWEAYFSVTGLKPVSGLKMSQLPSRAKQFNLIIGS